MLIKEISIEKLDIHGQYLVTSVNEGLDSKNDLYLIITLQDVSGSIEAKKWKATSDDKLTFTPGNILEIDAKATIYRDKLQLNINRATYIDSSNIDVSLFTPTAPVPLNELKNKLDQYINSIENESLKTITKYIIDKYYKDFISYPAATKNHHEYSSGLIHHTLSMADIAKSLCGLYQLDYDFLIAGALLHDIGKLKELSGPVLTKYTLEGNLLGHISIGNTIIADASKELNLENDENIIVLKHMILSHHGKMEYGSPVLPLTKEALILSMIDDLDAKIVISNKALEVTNKGEYTQKIFALDNRSFYKPNK